MKLFHLSDLHIGKRLNEFSLLEDQRFIFEKIFTLIEREKPDAILLAGDIYDKSVPSAEAVQLLDWFLKKLTQTGVPAFLIAGNHDSAERLAFGELFFSLGNVHVSPLYEGSVKKVVLKDAYGEVCIHLLPFIKPAMVRHVFPEETIESYEDAVRIVLSHMEVDCTKRNVLVAHQFVTGAMRCESEDVNVGGLDQINASCFDMFDYVALGHIHSPQSIGRDTVRYCGTPIKYSFSEAGQDKSVTVVEMYEKGQTELRFLPLEPLRNLRVIKGSYMEVTNRSSYDERSRMDYVHVTLTDEEEVLDGIQKLRTIYPNIMSLSYDNRRTKEARIVQFGEKAEDKSTLEWFEDFFFWQNNQTLSEEQKKFLTALIDKMAGGEG